MTIRYKIIRGLAHRAAAEKNLNLNKKILKDNYL